MFKSYSKTRKYCSFECYTTSDETVLRLQKNCVKALQAIAIKSKLNPKYCACCGIILKKRFRKFCDHCWETEWKLRRSGRKDKNHNSIISGLKYAGAAIIDLSSMGYGIPDILVSYHNVLYLMEIKNPDNAYGRRGMNKNQKQWAERWRGKKPEVVRSIDDALKIIGIK
jgi:hypothetical protein